MSRIFPGSRVEGRKPMRNLHTVSGGPRWNTYQGMDFTPTSFDGGGRIVKRGDAAKNHKDSRYTPCRRNGGGNKPKRIAPENLIHRCRKVSEGPIWVNQRHFAAARMLIVEYSRDRCEHLSERFGVHVTYLWERGAVTLIKELLRLTLARGCTGLLRWFK